MNLFAELEKLGISQDGELDITDDGQKAKKREVKIAAPAKVKEEKDLVMEKSVICDVCEGQFWTLAVKGSQIKRLAPDNDLRPRYATVDAVKYGVTSCPRCGYSALNKHFNHNSPSQRKWIQEKICINFNGAEPEHVELYTYDQAVERYKLALVNAMTRRAKLSEKAYICLNIAWLRREQSVQTSVDTPEVEKLKKQYDLEYEAFYKQAYEGFQKAMSTETSPFEGMDESTLEYLIANMAIHFEDYPLATKLLSGLMTRSTVSARLKDKCVELKDELFLKTKK